MEFAKQKLADVQLGYFITHLHLDGHDRILAAPEGPGSVLAFASPGFEPRVVAPEPGGCMGFAPLPGRDDAFLMITRFYPIFQSEGAGIDLFTAGSGLEEPWRGRRIIDLPFVHRIAVVGNGAEHFLVAAPVCGGKDFQDDWSRPGQTYVAPVPDDPEGPWDLAPVLDPIHKNHGLTVGVFRGADCVFLAGSEGLFALKVPRPGERGWIGEKILDHEISEIQPADLDGDGVDEMVVIEPFHGDTMAVYKDVAGTWTRVWSAPLAFGHGLWAGELGGERVVIVGNRSGDGDLVCHRVVSTNPFRMEPQVVDHGSGTTNVDVMETLDGQVLVASNPGHEEYALYRPVTG